MSETVELVNLTRTVAWEPCTRTKYTYDALNRLTKKTYSDGVTPIALYVYDTGNIYFSPTQRYTTSNVVGRLSIICQDIPGACQSMTAFSYDAMGRTIQTLNSTPSNPTTGAVYSTSANYDLAGNMTDLTYPDGRHIQQNWDGADHLAKVYSLDGGTETDCLQSATYFPNGQSSSVSYGNGVAEFTGLNSRFQTTSLVASNMLSSFGNPDAPAIPGYSFLSRNYSYSPPDGLSGCSSSGNNGNIWQIADALNPTAWTRKFGYDCLNRLSSSQVGSSLTNYSIDSFGNMSPMSGGAAVSTFDPATNRINNLPCASVLTPFDASGNQTCDTNHDGADRQYGFDSENRISRIAVLGSGSPFVNYIYHANGDRVRRSNADGTYTEYVNFNGQPISEIDQNGNWADYIYGNGGKIARQTSADTRIHFSATNSTGGSATAYTTPVSGILVQSGAKLVWRQYQDGPAIREAASDL